MHQIEVVANNRIYLMAEQYNNQQIHQAVTSTSYAANMDSHIR